MKKEKLVCDAFIISNPVYSIIAAATSKPFSDTNTSWLKMMNNNDDEHFGNDDEVDAGQDEYDLDVDAEDDDEDDDEDDAYDEDGNKLMKIERQARKIDKKKAADRFVVVV